MDPLTPSASVLIALGSLVVHYEEFTSQDGHAFDRSVIEGLRSQEDVREWFDAMDSMALLPVKRRDVHDE